MIGTLRRRWRAWKRRQPSRVIYAMVPGSPRISASGRLIFTVTVVELREPAAL